MMLTNDIPETKRRPMQRGTRWQATDAFKKLPIQDRLRAATVRLLSRGNHASGVFLGVSLGVAYVMTAKHVLWSLAGETSPSGLPNDYTLPSNKYPDGIQIAYDPENIESQPRATANVTTIDFGGINDNTWEYDIILMTSDDQPFCDFIRQNRFFTKDNYLTYQRSLRQGNDRYPLLSRSQYEFIQLGYGEARDPHWPKDVIRSNYTDFVGKLQCKPSQPSTDTAGAVDLYEPQMGKRRDQFPKRRQAVELDGSNVNSTGAGDSGGPLFCYNKTGFFLLGVTLGANWYGDERRLQNPPPDTNIENNVATYWYEIFDHWFNLFTSDPANTS